jgi:hypothetical protein
VSAVLPRDTLRLAASTDTVWIVASDLRRAKTLANELGQLGMTARVAPSVPPVLGSDRCALILDLRGVSEAMSDSWLTRARTTQALVVAWGGASETDSANIYSCESLLSEREVALLLFTAGVTPGTSRRTERRVCGVVERLGQRARLAPPSTPGRACRAMLLRTRAPLGRTPRCGARGWDVRGKTFEDVDGYRVVLEREAWTR